MRMMPQHFLVFNKNGDNINKAPTMKFPTMKKIKYVKQTTRWGYAHFYIIQWRRITSLYRKRLYWVGYMQTKDN